MRKRIFIALALVATMALTLVGIGSADLPGNGWYFGATIQNIGSAPANVVVTAYDSASANTYPYTVSPAIPAGGNTTVLPSTIPGLPSSFEGSMVTSSDQPLAAIVNVTNRAAGGLGIPDGKAAALYSGVDGTKADTTLSFPTFKLNFFNKTTTFYIQNAGANATTVDFDFIDDNGMAFSFTSGSIAPGQMVAVDPGLAGVPADSLGALTVTSNTSEPLVGVMLEHEHNTAAGTVLQGSAGFTSGDLDSIAYCPSVKKNFFGRSSGVQVQNAHSGAQDITVTFTGTTGTFNVTETDVQPGEGIVVINDASVPDGLYAVEVSGSAGNVAAIVNESEIPLTNARQTSVTYACIADANATTTVAYPSYKEVFFGRTTALQVQNVGGGTASNVVVSFTTSAGTFTSNPQTIGAGASTTLLCVSASSGFFNGAALGDSTISGVTITSDQPIVAVANEASWNGANPCSPNNGDTSFDKASAVGFNLP